MEILNYLQVKTRPPLNYKMNDTDIDLKTKKTRDENS